MDKPIKATPGSYSAPDATCSVDGCDNRPYSQWLCQNHSRQVRQRALWAVKPESKRRDNGLSRYAMTSATYDAMLAAQGGGCAICACPPIEGKRRHPVDHDHACCPGQGKTCGNCVRGILCMACNQALGHYEKSGYMPADFRRYIDSYRLRTVA
jgi:hypothetical protein